MLPGFKAHPSGTGHRRSRAFVAVAVVCLALLAFLSVAQVTHTHSVASDADHCQLCIVLHSVAPATATVASVALVLVARTVPSAEVRPLMRLWHPQLFTRPPPSNCLA
ncbi:MAG TPA: hypothetical protein VG893_01385 [Terracidiphilus sp.]|nr:hypothetical protein [Terracidiphilus sp.]